MIQILCASLAMVMTFPNDRALTVPPQLAKPDHRLMGIAGFTNLALV